MVEKMWLRLLGSFQVGTDLTLRRKNRAILAYLALSPRAITRHELANLFCQSAADPGHTIRLSLSRLRRALGEEALIQAGETVALNSDYFETDVYPFRQVLSAALDDVPSDKLAQTIHLYRGEFLTGLFLPDAPEFEMWLVGQRSYWRQLYERGALAWLKRLITDKQYTTALPMAQQLVQQNPLLEEAHYHLIWLYAQTEQRTAAMAQYEQCQTMLQQELAVEPTPALQALYADVVAGRLTHAPASAPVSPTITLSVTTVDFVERESEWQRLNEAWKAVKQGNGRTLLITAEAGGGKTRLVHEWVQTLPDALFLHGACYESTRTLAYHPWLKILEQLSRWLDTAVIKTLPAAWLDALSRLLPDFASHAKTGSIGEQVELFTAVHALLNLAPQPLLLFVDDWQWADAASLQLLHFLVERETPLMLVGAYRSEEVEDNPALLTLLGDWARRQDIVTMKLAPLSGTAVTELINRLWPKLPPGYREPYLRDRLIQATGGNPLFVNEIVRELAGSTHLPEELPVPPSLRDLIRRRLRQLPASGRQVLESLAVLDQPVKFDLVRQISGRSEDETLAALELGLRWRLLQTTGDNHLDFSHDLMQQGVRQQLTPIRRQLLHRRTAVALKQQAAPAATLAYHWGQAGEAEPERLWAIEAGQDAARVYAYQEAVRYYQRALGLTTDKASQAWLHHELGQIWMILGDWHEAERLFQMGLTLMAEQDGLIKAKLQVAYAVLLENQGEYADALAHEESALAYFRTVNDRPQIARTLGLIALLYGLQGRYDEALETCQQALADPEALTDPIIHIRLLNANGAIFWRRQAYDTALDYLQQAYKLTLSIHDRRHEALVLRGMGNVVYKLGQFDQAITYYQRCLEISQTMQDKQGVAMDWTNLALMYFYKGDDEAALDYGHRALQMARELGTKGGVALLLGNLASSLTRLERYEDSFVYYLQGLQIDAAIGNRRGQLIHAGNMGVLYLLWGHTKEALACLAYALSLDDKVEHTEEMSFHLTTIAAVYLTTNQLAQAETLLQWALTLQRGLDSDFELCWVFLVQGRLFMIQERFADAADSLQKAVQSAQFSHRRDIQFEAEVLLPRTQYLAEQIEVSEAWQCLQALLENQPGPRQQAAIYYEQWQLDKSSNSQAQARRAYETALQRTPTAETRERALELGVTDLPPTVAVPLLPSLIADTPLNIESLLEKVKQNLIHLL